MRRIAPAGEYLRCECQVEGCGLAGASLLFDQSRRLFHQLQRSDSVPFKAVCILAAAPVMSALVLAGHNIAMMIGPPVAVCDRLQQAKLSRVCGGKFLAQCVGLSVEVELDQALHHDVKVVNYRVGVNFGFENEFLEQVVGILVIALVVLLVSAIPEILIGTFRGRSGEGLGGEDVQRAEPQQAGDEKAFHNFFFPTRLWM